MGAAVEKYSRLMLAISLCQRSFPVAASRETK